MCFSYVFLFCDFVIFGLCFVIFDLYYLFCVLWILFVVFFFFTSCFVSFVLCKSVKSVRSVRSERYELWAVRPSKKIHFQSILWQKIKVCGRNQRLLKKGQTHTHADIAITRLNRPRASFSENSCHYQVTVRHDKTELSLTFWFHATSYAPFYCHFQWNSEVCYNCETN